MQKSTRAKLVRLYYELCLVPGIEPRVLRSWADMLSRLLANKPGIKPKLDATDLSLPWKPLWRILQKELWPKSTLDDSTYVSYYRTTLYLFINTFRRNLVNILLYLADQCKRYYSPQEIPLMLETFLPLLTKEV
jgi:proteasome activator subunit 4